MEKALLLVDSCKKSARLVEKVMGVGRNVLGRAKKAKQKGRDVNTHGRPPALNTAGVEKMMKWLGKRSDTGMYATAKQFHDKVCYSFIYICAYITSHIHLILYTQALDIWRNTPGQNLAQSAPSFNRQYMHRLIKANAEDPFKFRASRLIEEVCNNTHT